MQGLLHFKAKGLPSVGVIHIPFRFFFTCKINFGSQRCLQFLATVLWWVGGLKQLPSVGVAGQTKPADTIHDFSFPAECQISVRTPPDIWPLRFIPVTICWNPAWYAERRLLNLLQWLSCFAERGASRCSHGCPRMRLVWNMGTYTRGWPRGSKGSTSKGT